MTRCRPPTPFATARSAAWAGLLASLWFAGSAVAQDAGPRIQPLPSMRERADVQQAWLEQRLESVLPQVMRRHGVSMWILSMREYGEDPVFWSIRSPTVLAARRRSIYIFHDRGDEVERIALGGQDMGGLYEIYREQSPWSDTPELVGDEQWAQLRQIVEERDPENIALNIDELHAFSDGLGAGERDALERALGPYTDRVVRRPEVAIDYLATRIPEMLPAYRSLQETVHALIARGFSNEVITPGVTSTEEVRWWLRDRVREHGMTVWFHPSVSVQRDGQELSGDEAVIERGDVLWVDFGVVALGMHTDTQHLGYVLRDGETEPPAGIRACLAASNRMQDLLLGEMIPGRTGNEVLAATLEAMRREEIEGTVYTHPIGDHGHGAGPLIGRWDDQDGLPGRGDLPLRPMTWHSIELQASVAIPEWGDARLSCRQEEEAHLDERGERDWVLRRQDRFHIVR